MLDVEQRYLCLHRLPGGHEIPERLGPTDVEDPDGAIELAQQVHEQCESGPPHSCCERSTAAVVRERFDE